MDESGTEDSEWTEANLLKLLASIKSSILVPDRMRTYLQGLKTMDWNKVAFPPFSAEACKQKWSDILQKLSKTRTLTELVDVAKDVVSNPVRNKQVHPDLPKRPGPPNALFVEEQRAEYRMKHPKLSQQTVMTNLSKKYSKLPAEEKVKYQEKHKKATQEYKGAMEVFGERCKRKHKKRRTSHQKNAQVAESTQGVPPKPVLSGYHLFCKEFRSSSSILEGGSSLAVCAERWRAMSDDEKEKYNQCQRQLQRQYLDDMNKYLMNFGREKQQQILKANRIARPMSTPKNQFPGEPKMPDGTGRGIFFKKQMLLLSKRIPNSRQRLSMVNKLWMNLPLVEKQHYKHQVSGAIVQYSMALQKWFKTLPKACQCHYQSKKPTKIKYLNPCQMKDEFEVREPHDSAYRPSDSEDELTQDSTDEELDEVEEEDDNEVISFEVY
ncbi:uncharacterized protein ACO6RY_16312 [Pungitius sinensis]